MRRQSPKSSRKQVKEAGAPPERRGEAPGRASARVVRRISMRVFNTLFTLLAMAALR